MSFRKIIILGFVLSLFCMVLFLPSFGQYREYYIYGKVVDTNSKPVEGVKITLQDKNSSRGYSVKTNKKGEYKLIGLPHGIYSVAIEKEGYETKTDEWDFNIPQDRMQKVEMETIVMVTRDQFSEFKRAKQAEADFKEATEKMQQEDFDAAVEILKRMVTDNPRDANAFYLLGIAYMKKQMYPEAIEALTKVTELTPSFAGSFHQLGLCYQQQHEKERALQYFEKALERKPDSVDSLYNAGLILFELSRIPEALTHFEKALEQSPDDPEFLEMAGRCYIHQGDYAKAIDYLEKAKGLSTDQGKIDFLDQLITKIKEQIKE
jgi:tetratricopeptide (TPR) repeat protein